MDILVMGDFSAAAFSEASKPTNDLRPQAVNIDNFDSVIARLAPELHFSIGPDDNLTKVEFNCLDDFHPDNLVKQLDQLNHAVPDNRPQSGTEPAAKTEAHTPHDSSTTNEDDAQTLTRLLGRSPLEVEQQRAVGKRPGKAKRALIEEVVRRLAEKSPVAEAEQASAGSTAGWPGTDNAALNLRAMLHAAPFRALEASWRSLDWLVRTIEDGAHTRIFLLDINRPALATALEESSDLNKSHLYRVLNDYFENEILIIGDYRFGSEPEDIRLLSRLGLLARELNGSFIAEADSNFFENDGVEAENSWRTLRESAAASHLGLAFPRVLLRLPYGERSDPIESFAFEEIAGRPTGNAYLWGNPAFACAILSVINRIRAKPESLTVIGEMPAYSYREDGESRLQPCTEQLLSESEADKILSQGVMPVLGSKNRNSIQIPWLHTLVLQQVSIDGLSEP